jgi:hypothetical protein
MASFPEPFCAARIDHSCGNPKVYFFHRFALDGCDEAICIVHCAAQYWRGYWRPAIVCHPLDRRQQTTASREG